MGRVVHCPVKVIQGFIVFKEEGMVYKNFWTEFMKEKVFEMYWTSQEGRETSRMIYIRLIT